MSYIICELCLKQLDTLGKLKKHINKEHSKELWG